MKYASKLDQRLTFFFVTVGVITITYALLFVIDFLPEKPETESLFNEESLVEAEDPAYFPPIEMEAEVANALPTKIIFDSLNKEVAVLNPEVSDVASLDAALLKGTVRHPDSADFANTGTMFILGHSSHLPVVHNKNFQAFNDIEKLEWGDTVRVQSADTEYVYRVDRVYEAKASAAEVPLQFEEARLVLVTCNTFGVKEDRYIVEAYLIEKKAL